MRYLGNKLRLLIKKSVMKYVTIFLILSMLLVTSCKKSFLDVVPDNVPTLENAFENRVEAKKFLATCYSWLPQMTQNNNVFFMGTDAIWSYEFNNDYPGAWNIAKGLQNVNKPYSNYWSGTQNNVFDKNYFQAIRDCNIFLKNIKDRDVINLEPEDKRRWIGEVEFLKAYYHFFLMRMYGPIPIVDKNLPISVDPEKAKVYRAPFDSCVNYVGSLLDDAISKLPLNITKQATEYGRATAVAALFLKAKLLVTAASPLFNGNSDYSNFRDKKGRQLIDSDFDPEKCVRAAKATKEAVEAAEEAGFKLYRFEEPINSRLTDTTIIKLSIRGSISAQNDRNTEAIWNFSGRNGGENGDDFQKLVIPQNIDIAPSVKDVFLGSYYSVSLKIAELFYTNNGVPIDEDKDWNYNDRYGLKEATTRERYNIEEGYTTAALNFNRGSRFYANLGFDGGAYYLQGAGSDDDNYYLHGKLGQPQGKTKNEWYNVTGYWPKKFVNWTYTDISTGGHSTIEYSWPIFKLNDLYLLYAEALNEIGEGDMAIQYLDKIRKRANLQGVKKSWSQHSKNPGKFSTKDGLRKIIHRERYIELAFEGQRIWDMRRWKDAGNLMNEPVRGWDILQSDPNLYYRPKVIFDQSFTVPRDYLWPIKENDIIENPNLVQNPGW